MNPQDRRRSKRRVKIITPESEASARAVIKKQIEEQKKALEIKAQEEAQTKALEEWDRKVKEEARIVRELKAKVLADEAMALKEEREKVRLVEEHAKRRAATTAAMAVANALRLRQETEAKEKLARDAEEAHTWVWDSPVLKRLSGKARTMFLVSGWKDPIATKAEIEADPEAFRVKWETAARKSVDQK